MSKNHSSPLEDELIESTAENDELMEFKDLPLNQKGWGMVSKYIMTDPELDLDTKALLCELQALSNSHERTSYPSRRRIMDDLGVSRERHDKSVKALVAAGIIEIERLHKGSLFGHNLYSFPVQPKRYMNYNGDNKVMQAICREVRQYGVMAKHGLCPYRLMCDKRLDRKAKPLFTLISCYINITEKPYAELKPKLIAAQLGINDPHTINKYFNQLTDLNYLTVERVRKGGRLTGISRYSINYIGPFEAGSKESEDTESSPNVKKQTMEASPNVKKQTMETSPNVKKQTMETSPNVKKQTMEASPNVKKQAVAKQAAAKQTTNSTCSTSTSLNQTIYDGLIDWTRKKINYQHIEFLFEMSPGLEEATNLLVETITELMYSTNPMCVVNGEYLKASYVKQELRNIDNTAAMNVLNRCLASWDKIRDKKAYLLTCIVNEIRVPTKEEDDDEDLFGYGF